MNPFQPEAVVIGASAGAVDALSTILGPLPVEFSIPVIIVVHVPSDQKSLLAELFGAKCRLPVREPDDKEPIAAGVVYIAPPDYHLLVEREKVFSLSNEEPVCFCRPSIDVLFESAAEAYTTQLIGIILTGANHDGAAGLARVVKAGGKAIVQRPDTAQSPIMPLAALKSCPDAQPLDLNEIVDYLKEFV